MKHYRYCLPLKAVISASGRADVLLPSLSFELKGTCEPPPPPLPPAPPPVPVCAEHSTKCDAEAWKCKTCKAGASNPTDCMGDCLPGYKFNKTCDDCTGVCTKLSEVAEEDELSAQNLLAADQAHSARYLPTSQGVVAHVEIFAYDPTTDTLAKPALARLPVGGPCGQALAFSGSTAPARFNATWVVAVATLDNASAPLAKVELTVQYEHSGDPVARPPSPLVTAQAFPPHCGIQGCV